MALAGSEPRARRRMRKLAVMLSSSWTKRRKAGSSTGASFSSASKRSESQLQSAGDSGGMAVPKPSTAQRAARSGSSQNSSPSHRSRASEKGLQIRASSVMPMALPSRLRSAVGQSVMGVSTVISQVAGAATASSSSAHWFSHWGSMGRRPVFPVHSRLRPRSDAAVCLRHAE